MFGQDSSGVFMLLQAPIALGRVRRRRAHDWHLHILFIHQSSHQSIEAMNARNHRVLDGDERMK
jgi:hypothetical protein